MGEPDDPLIPDFALARYLPSGALDTAFGELLDAETGERSGKLVTNFGLEEAPEQLTYDEANGVLELELPDGTHRIVVVGSTRAELEGPNDFAWAMYSSEGELLGKYTTDFGGDDFARKVAYQVVGATPMLVVVGTSALPDSPTDADFAVARYTLDGALDPNFGVGGMMSIDFFAGKDDAVDVLINSSNKIIVVGHIKDSSRVEPQLFGGPLDFGLAQLTVEGQLDGTFGTLVDPEEGPESLRTGKVSTDLASTIYQNDPEMEEVYSTDESWAGALQVVDEEEKIVVAGRYGAKGVSDFALVRYTALGELDPNFGVTDEAGMTFGANGAQHTDILGGPDAAYDVLIRNNNQIVLAGRATLNAKFTWAMTRYEENGGHLETLTIPYFAGEEGGPDQANSVVEDENHNLVVAGWVSMPGTMVDFGIARFTETESQQGLLVAPQVAAVDQVYTELAEPTSAPWSKPGFSGPGPAPWAPPHRGSGAEELTLEAAPWSKPGFSGPGPAPWAPGQKPGGAEAGIFEEDFLLERLMKKH